METTGTNKELSQLVLKELERLNAAVILLGVKIDNGISTKIANLQGESKVLDVRANNLESRAEELEDSNKWLWRSVTGAIITAIAVGLVSLIFATARGH